MNNKSTVIYVLVGLIALGFLFLTLNRYRFYRNYIDIGRYYTARTQLTTERKEAFGFKQVKSDDVQQIDINSASLDTLVQLPGIGRETALRIIEYRNEYGDFTTVDDLIHVHGIGVKKLEKLRDCVIIR